MTKKLGRRTRGTGGVFHYKTVEGQKWAYQLPPNLDPMRKPHYGYNSRTDAEEALDDARKSLRSGVPLLDKNVTVADYWKSFIETQDQWKFKTKEGHQQSLIRMAPYIGEVSLQDLNAAMIRAAYSRLEKPLNKHTRPLAATTVNVSHVHLKQMLKQAVEDGLITKNPGISVRRRGASREKLNYFTSEEVSILFTITRDDREYSLWVVLITTGIRIGEALALNWDDIDFSKRALSVTKTIYRKGREGLVIDDVKTKSSRRSIDLDSETIAVLKHHQIAQKEERLKNRLVWQDENLVFPALYGKRCDPTTIRYHFANALVRANLKKIRVHDLRHTCATYLLNKGYDVKFIQMRLGHSSAIVTYDVYAHLLPERQAAVAESFTALFPR